MAFVGADTGQLRELADLMAKSANELTGDLVPTISGRLSSSPWQGPDRQQFDHRWNSQLIHQIRNAATALDNAAKTARKNADDQDRTSENLDGPLGNSGGGGVFPIGKGQSFAGEQQGHSMPFQRERDVIQKVFDDARNIEPYGLNLWDVAKLGSKMSKLMDNELPFMGTISNMLKTYDIANSILNGKPDVQKITHAVADVIGKGKSPLAKLVSLNMHVWTDVAAEAKKADFSPEGRDMAWKFVKNNPMETVKIIGESTVEVGKRLVGWLPIPRLKK